MYNPDTDLLFPPRVMPAIRDLRGVGWRELVDTIIELEVNDAPARLGFELLMVRICGCINCQADSFKAMQGCTQCAIQAVRRYRVNDTELLNQFGQAEQEIMQHLQH